MPKCVRTLVARMKNLFPLKLAVHRTGIETKLEKTFVFIYNLSVHIIVPTYDVFLIHMKLPGTLVPSF
jgi:hypothetical protein